MLFTGNLLMGIPAPQTPKFPKAIQIEEAMPVRLCDFLSLFGFGDLAVSRLIFPVN
jgi:hypothetical protein